MTPPLAIVVMLTGTDLINHYMTKVHRATLHDEVVGEALVRVMNLMASPASLFHPRIVWHVLRKQLSPMTAPSLPAAVGDEHLPAYK